MTRKMGTQGELAQLIREAAQAATNQADPPARYVWSPPDPFFWLCELTLIAVTVGLLAGVA